MASWLFCFDFNQCMHVLKQLLRSFCFSQPSQTTGAFVCLKIDLLASPVELNPGFIYHHSFVGRRSRGGWHLKWKRKLVYLCWTCFLKRDPVLWPLGIFPVKRTFFPVSEFEGSLSLKMADLSSSRLVVFLNQLLWAVEQDVKSRYYFVKGWSRGMENMICQAGGQPMFKIR